MPAQRLKAVVYYFSHGSIVPMPKASRSTYANVIKATATTVVGQLKEVV